MPAGCRAAGVDLITRVVDYGGLFHDDVPAGHEFRRGDHRSFRPAGWVERGRERMDSMRPIAEARGLTMLQLACEWNLAHDAVACAAPTLIQESGPSARPIEDKRADLAGVSARPRLSAADVADAAPDRRQHRLHGAEGRGPRSRGGGAAGSLAGQPGAGGARRALGHRPGSRSQRRRHGRRIAHELQVAGYTASGPQDFMSMTWNFLQRFRPTSDLVFDGTNAGIHL